MMRSLYSGVSGLKSHQTRMDVIGNNIANINTIGFKGSRTTFSDMLSQLRRNASGATSTRGGVNPSQVGLGVDVESIDLMFQDSSAQQTGKNTDLALAGNGLFVLAAGDQYYYTRNGAFSFDEQGYYVMPGNGLRVQGWNASSDGVLDTNGLSTDVFVPVGKTMDATETTQMTYSGNLDKESRIIDRITYTPATGADVDPNRVITTSAIYNTDVTITITGNDGFDAINETVRLSGNKNYASGSSVIGEITTSLVRGAADTTVTTGDPPKYYYDLIFKDSQGNTIARTKSSASYEEGKYPTAGKITAVARAASTRSPEEQTQSVNVDGVNVIAARITFRDGTTMNVTDGYYQVGHSVPITTLATVYDSLGSKHEVTVLLEKDYDTADENLTDENAEVSGSTYYTYQDASGNVQRALVRNDDPNLETVPSTPPGGDDTYNYTKTYTVTRTANTGEDAATNPYIYTYKDESGISHTLTNGTDNMNGRFDAEALTYEITYTNVAKGDTVYYNRWRAYIAPGVGELGPASDTFTNSYERSQANGNPEADGSKTVGTMSTVTYLYFNDRGGFISNGQDNDSSITFEYSEGNGAASGQTVIDFSGLTQYASSSTSFPTTNGNTAGILQSLAVDASGIISGTYTNGLIRTEAQVAVAQFTNAAGLTKIGTTLYQESNNSGTANIRTVDIFGLTITSSALEMSGVDLATEFADMIVTQRGFQANSKMTTVADEMLETVVNMKR